MNAIILFIIGIPLIEIYLMIKVGGIIGAFNTIFLIFFTAITGVYFARLAGLNAIRSGFNHTNCLANTELSGKITLQKTSSTNIIIGNHHIWFDMVCRTDNMRG